MSAHSKITNDEALKLIKQFKSSNNQELIAKLYKPYMRMVLGVGLKYYKDLAKAEDLVIDVYEILNKKIAHHQINNVSSWIYSVAKNACLMELRKKKREVSTENFNFEARFVESEQILHLFEDDKKENELTALQECIEQLKEDQKAGIKSFYLESKTYKQIAQEKNLDLKKVKSLIQNGKRNLKNCMDSK